MFTNSPLKGTYNHNPVTVKHISEYTPEEQKAMLNARDHTAELMRYSKYDGALRSEWKRKRRGRGMF